MRHRWSKMFLGKWSLALVAVAGFVVCAGVPSARAKDDDCRERIARADHRLHDAIEHHGRDSREAERASHELREERERCWTSSHRWWDEDQQKWRSERDWDDRDHYRRDDDRRDDDRR